MKKCIGILLSMMMVFMIGAGLAHGGVDQENIVPDESVDPARIASATGLDEEIIRAYMEFLQKKQYEPYLQVVYVEVDHLIERYDDMDMASLYDFDQDGIPELIVQSRYVFDEMLDVFAYNDGDIQWLGNVGYDENFYQTILCYDSSGIPGKIYAFIGGVRESIFEYEVHESKLTEREIGTTVFDFDQDMTTDVELFIENDHLQELLYETGTYGNDTGEHFIWNYVNELKAEEDWIQLFSGERKIGKWRVPTDENL